MIDFERVVNMDALYQAWQKISQRKGCPGVDCVDLSLYRSDLQKNLRTLQTSVVTGYYQPHREKTYTSKNRTICISCVDDKIIQTLLAGTIMSYHNPTKSVHSFIHKRSIFTAKKTLDNALRNGISDYAKVDIKRFYDSIDINMLYDKLSHIFTDARLLELFALLLKAHYPGISTGSCLSPALSNLYLDEFDRHIEAKSMFYARYVDDMLVAPISTLPLLESKLGEEGLGINAEKSSAVNASDGFRYLGFDIKQDIEAAIQNKDFSLAEAIYEAKDSDVTAEAPLEVKTITEPQRYVYEPPNAVKNVVKKCGVVNSIVKKAKTAKHLSFAEKTHLLQIFHCLDEAGAKFIHHVLSNCDDYDYAETQRRIDRYSGYNPVGCKKLRERVGDDGTRCLCNFSMEKMYPTPIIHAIRVDSDCFKPALPKDSIGHFKARNPKDKAVDALSAIMELNKKQYEIQEQQKILKSQIEDLFERSNTRELLTPQGLMVKTDDGIFLKVG